MKIIKNPIIISLFIIIIFAFFGVKALLKPGYYTSHDGWHQVVRLYYFHQSIKENIIPPQFVTHLYNGYGYPLYIFSYHLPWILAEPFLISGLSVFDAIKAVYFVGYVASGITMFIFLRTRFDSLESTIGSILYIWAPYRFSNIFVRGSIGEATIFIFIPLLFLAIDKAKEKFTKKHLVIGSLSVASIILSHAMTAVLVFGMVSIFIIVNLLFTKKKIKALSYIFLLLLLGFGIASYYLIPSVYLKEFTKFDELIKSTRFDGQSVQLKDLIYSRWGYGFASPRQQDSMSFQIGIAHWLVAVLVTVYLINSKIFRKKLKYPGFIIGLYLIFFLSVILMLPVSESFWRYTSDKIFHIDFPWRLLTISVFSLSALGTYLLSLVKFKKRLLIASVIVFIAVYTNRNHLRVNEYTNIPMDLYLLSEDTTNTYDEYLPKEADGNFLEKVKEGGQIKANPKVKIEKADKLTNKLSFKYTSPEKSEIIVNLLFFPGWRLTIDGNNQEVKPAEKGLISFNAPSGEHFVELEYYGLRLAKISQMITFLSLFLVFILSIKYLFSSKQLSK